MESSVGEGRFVKLFNALDTLTASLKDQRINENKEFAEATATHEESIETYNQDITNAKEIIATSQQLLQNTLIPSRKAVRKLIKR